MMGKIYITDSTNPAHNLAFEEMLLNRGKEILYLWQNENTVVIGKNQNPYKECRLDTMKEDDVTLVRRKSGGGAVYHDLGNLNFTLIRSKDVKIEENFQFIIQALKNVGIESRFDGRNDLTVNGKKFSGNAYYKRGNFLCHHGTIMIDVDVTKVNNYLQPSKLKLNTKSIDSVRKRVINLKEINPKISVESVKNALISEYKKLYFNPECIFISSQDMEVSDNIKTLARDYSSWEATYSESPSYDITIEDKFTWGIISINFSVRLGQIVSVSIDTDSIVPEEFDYLASELTGKEFKSTVLTQKVTQVISDERIAKDIITLFQTIQEP